MPTRPLDGPRVLRHLGRVRPGPGAVPRGRAVRPSRSSPRPGLRERSHYAGAAWLDWRELAPVHGAQRWARCEARFGGHRPRHAHPGRAPRPTRAPRWPIRPTRARAGRSRSWARTSGRSSARPPTPRSSEGSLLHLSGREAGAMAARRRGRSSDPHAPVAYGVGRRRASGGRARLRATGGAGQHGRGLRVVGAAARVRRCTGDETGRREECDVRTERGERDPAGSPDGAG